MKFVEKWFWLICVAVTLAGLLIPALGVPFRRLIPLLLAGILFFTGLKLDFSAAVRELRRPVLLIYVIALSMIVLPLGMWLLALWILPAFALGVLILAAMPAGVATSSLTDIVRGNAALALVITLLTSLACPIVVPLVISAATTGAGGTLGGGYLARQAGYLAFVLLTPMAAAWIVRRLFPAAVARHREAFTGLSIVSLSLLILGAMSKTSDDCLRLVRAAPGQAVGLVVFLFAFSAVLHVAGYLLAPWRPPADRAAISITTAYVNNGLGIVFASQFFVPAFGPAALLPCILLEIPMVLAILPVRSYLAWVTARQPPARPSPISPSPPGLPRAKSSGRGPGRRR